MHLALRRYADPPRGFVPFFCLGVLAGVLGLAIVASSLGPDGRIASGVDVGSRR